MRRHLLIAALCASVVIVGACTGSDEESEGRTLTAEPWAVAMAGALVTEEDVAAAFGVSLTDLVRLPDSDRRRLAKLVPDQDALADHCQIQGGYIFPREIEWVAATSFSVRSEDFRTPGDTLYQLDIVDVDECIGTGDPQALAGVVDRVEWYFSSSTGRPTGRYEPDVMAAEAVGVDRDDDSPHLFLVVRDGNTLISVTVSGPSVTRDKADRLVAAAVGGLPFDG
jgi:hypothetical protein